MNIKKRFERLYLRFIPEKRYISFLRKKGVKIGDGCVIDKTAHLETEGYMFIIGNNVRITEGCQLIPHDGALWTLQKNGLLQNADYFRPIIIGDNTFLGNNVTVLPGIKIGCNCIIACGAVVTKDVPDNCVYGGVPARFIETIDSYYEKRKDKVDYIQNMSYKGKEKYLRSKFKI